MTIKRSASVQRTENDLTFNDRERFAFAEVTEMCKSIDNIQLDFFIS